MSTHTPLAGAFRAQKKNGDIYYRSSFTYRNKHISLGSFASEEDAHKAYLEALAVVKPQSDITMEHMPKDHILSFEKYVCLLNFRDNDIYIKNPVYLRKSYFEYYYSRNDIYLFDLFYYSEHKLMKRGEHLFVSDYGMQVTILSRYGIQSHAVAGKDYVFINGNSHDLRYENIHILNPYFGVRHITRKGTRLFQAKIHVRGDYVIGTYKSADEAAIAYNKAIDLLKEAGSPKNYEPNYLEHLTGKQYADIYSRIEVSDKLRKLTF